MGQKSTLNSQSRPQSQTQFQIGQKVIADMKKGWVANTIGRHSRDGSMLIEVISDENGNDDHGWGRDSDVPYDYKPMATDTYWWVRKNEAKVIGLNE